MCHEQVTGSSNNNHKWSATWEEAEEDYSKSMDYGSNLLVAYCRLKDFIILVQFVMTVKLIFFCVLCMIAYNRSLVVSQEDIVTSLVRCFGCVVEDAATSVFCIFDLFCKRTSSSPYIGSAILLYL
jgi:hypothetical protein